MLPVVNLRPFDSRATDGLPEFLESQLDYPIPLSPLLGSEDLSEGKEAQSQILAESSNYLAVALPSMAADGKYPLFFWEKKDKWSTALFSDRPLRAVKFVNFASNTGASATDYEVQVWTVKGPHSPRNTGKLFCEVLIRFSMDPSVESPISNLSFFIDANIQAPNIFLLCRYEALILPTASHIRNFDNRVFCLKTSDATTIRNFDPSNIVSTSSLQKKTSDRPGAPYGAACAISDNGIFAFQVDTYDIIATTGANSATPKWPCCVNEPVLNLLFLPTDGSMGAQGGSFLSGSTAGIQTVPQVPQLATLLAVSRKAVTEWKLSGVSDPHPVRQFVFGESQLVSVVSSGSILAFFNDKKEVALVSSRDSIDSKALLVSLHSLPVQLPGLPRISFVLSKRQQRCHVWFAYPTCCRSLEWGILDNSAVKSSALADSIKGGKMLPTALVSSEAPPYSDNKGPSGGIKNPAFASFAGVSSAINSTLPRSQPFPSPIAGILSAFQNSATGGVEGPHAAGVKEAEPQRREGNLVPTGTATTTISLKPTADIPGPNDLLSVTVSGMVKKTSPNDNKVVLPTFCGSTQATGGAGGPGPSVLFTVAEQGKADVKKWLSEIETGVRRVDAANAEAAEDLFKGTTKLISLSLEALMTNMEEHVKDQLLPSGGSKGAALPRYRDGAKSIKADDAAVKSYRKENEQQLAREVKVNLQIGSKKILEGVTAAVATVCKKDMIALSMNELKQIIRDSQRSFFQKRFDELMKEPSLLVLNRLEKSFNELRRNVQGEVERTASAFAALKQENEQLRQCIARLTSPRMLNEMENLRAEVAALRETVNTLRARNATSAGFLQGGTAPSVLSTVLHLIRIENNLAGGLQLLVAAQNPLLSVSLLQELTQEENDALIDAAEEAMPVEICANFLTQLGKGCILLIQDPLAAKSIMNDYNFEEVRKLVREVASNIVDIMAVQPALIEISESSSLGKTPERNAALRRMKETMNELIQTLENNWRNDASFENVIHNLIVSLR